MWNRAFLMMITAIVLCVSLVGGSFAADEGNILWSVTYFGEAGEDYLYRPSDIAVDAAKSLLYVVDSGNNRVVVFDLDGKFVRTIGREGQGPGEFSNPTGACVFGESQLAVADYGNSRIQIFHHDGEFERNIVLKEVRAADVLVLDGLFHTVPAFGASGFNINMGSKAETQPLAIALDQNGEIVKEFRVADFPDTHPFIRALKHRVMLALSPDGRFYFPYANMNLIQVFDSDATKLEQFDRPLPFKAIKPELLSQKSGKAAGQAVVQMRARMDMVSQAAHFGPDGYLYILTYTASLDQMRDEIEDPRDIALMPMRFDVIDPKSNTLLRTLDCDPGTRAFAPVDAGRLVYVHEDEAGDLVIKCVQY